MKARADAIIQTTQAEYLENLTEQTDPLLLRWKRTGRARCAGADREVARFIEITARATGAKRALEIGMAIGHTTKPSQPRGDLMGRSYNRSQRTDDSGCGRLSRARGAA